MAQRNLRTLTTRLQARAPGPLLATGLVWAALAGTAVFWGLRFMSGSTPVPPHVQTVAIEPAVLGDAQRLFGSPKATESARPTTVAAASRFKLHGVVAAATEGGSGGVATLSVDGGPARAYRVGAAVDAEWVLQSITQRGVQIGPRDGAAAVVLDIPPVPVASVGVLPSAYVPAAEGAYSAEGREGSAGVTEMPPLMMEPPAAGAQAPATRLRARGQDGAPNKADAAAR